MSTSRRRITSIDIAISLIIAVGLTAARLEGAVYRNLGVIVESKRAVETGQSGAVLFRASESHSDFHHAMRLLSTSLKTNQQDCRTRGTLGRIFVRQGLLQNAIAMFQSYPCVLDPLDRLWFGLALFHAGNQAEAEKVWSAVQEVAWFFSYQARQEKGEGQYERARTLYQLAINIAPKNAIAHREYGYLVWDLGELEEARSHFQEAAGLFEADAYEKNMILGESARMYRAYNIALQYYEIAARALPSSPLPHVRRGDIYSAVGDWQRALAEYVTALGVKFHHVDALLGASRAAAKLGNYEAAQGFLQQAKEVAPESEYPWLYAGRLLREQGRYELALNELEIAFKANPLNQAVAYEAGVIYFDMKDFPRALTHLELAARLGPPRSWVYEALVRTATALGEQSRACSYASHVNASWPDLVFKLPQLQCDGW